MTPERFERINRVLNARQPDLTIIADEVHKGRNLAAIVRTSDAVGIDTIYSVQPESGYQAYRGTALGSEKWVNVECCERLEIPVVNLKRKGFQLITTAVDGDSRDYREIDYTKPTALIFGAENTGVSAKAKAQADALVSIPMMGMIESFNVSVACAIILLEAQNQRLKAGLYDKRRLDDATYKDRFFCWAHPVIAKYCQANQLSYPLVREDGEIDSPADWYAKVRQLKG